MSIFDTDRLITEEALISIGFTLSQNNEEYLYYKVINNNRWDGCKYMCFNIKTRELSKNIYLPTKRIIETVFVEDIDDLVVYMHKWE
jgi:hypothetical protein